MSLFARIMPNALCCFHAPVHNDNDTQPLPLRPVPHIITRKPMLYAMINVPHEPEMTDAYAFRKLFTQSPACPHEDTPISGAPQRLRRQGSLELDYTFNSGSPLPAAKKTSSIQKLSQHVKQKMSESRLSKASSRADLPLDNRIPIQKDCEKQAVESATTMLGISARSTGLSDLLRSREGSLNRYDSDAESIKTPQFLSPAATIRLTSIDASYVNDGISRPTKLEHVDRENGNISSPEVSLLGKPRSTSCPQTPKKDVYTHAGRVDADSASSLGSRRLSLREHGGMNSNLPSLGCQIDPILPGEPSLADRNKLESQGQSSILHNTPQEIVTNMEQCSTQEENIAGSSEASDLRSTALLESLDPAMVQYLARFTPSRPSSNTVEDKISPQTIVRNSVGDQYKDHEPDEQPTDCNESLHSEASPPKPTIQAQALRSVHLFDMHISQTLASKSQATFLSPTASGKTSVKSFDANTSMLPSTSQPRSHAGLNISGVRAEHNRRPSDPHTKKLFEQGESCSQPYWLRREQSSATSKTVRLDRDDASSYYTYDAGPPSSAGNLSTLDGAQYVRSNPNSIAVGGRAASYDFPPRRVDSGDVTRHLTHGAPMRSLSTSHTQGSSLLNLASNLIQSYTDGSVEKERDNTIVSPRTNASTDIAGRSTPTVNNNVLHPQNNKSSVAGQQDGTGWLTADQRFGWNYDFSRSSSPTDRRSSAVSMIAPDARPEQAAETATDMWNRAYRVARDGPNDRPLLSPTAFEMDELRRKSSVSTVRQKHYPDLPRDTTRDAVRRSQSEGPRTREPLTVSTDRERLGISRTLKRLSFLQLRNSKTRKSHENPPGKLSKRSAPQLSKKPSFAASKHSVSSLLRPGHTPPLKELLGIWGSFPEYGRDARIGPAGEADSVHTQDFAARLAMSSAPNVPNENLADSKQRSLLQQTMRALSFRISKSNKKKGRSMSFPADDRTPREVLVNSWRRLYRTKSSEWRGYMTGGGHRTSISAGQLAEYPELETLPGEGLFGTRVGRTNFDQ